MKKNKSGVKFGNQSADWSKALQKIWIAWFWNNANKKLPPLALVGFDLTTPSSNLLGGTWRRYHRPRRQGMLTDVYITWNFENKKEIKKYSKAAFF
jgi:hypothetical protein